MPVLFRALATDSNTRVEESGTLYREYVLFTRAPARNAYSRGS